MSNRRESPDGRQWRGGRGRPLPESGAEHKREGKTARTAEGGTCAPHYERAIEKIRDEMAAQADSAVIEAVGEMMTARLMADPDIAGMVMAEGKTLMGAYQAIYDFAKKNRGKESAICVPPKKAMEIIAEYYGFSAEDKETHAPAAPSTHRDDALDLDALLGM